MNHGHASAHFDLLAFREGYGNGTIAPSGLYGPPPWWSPAPRPEEEKELVQDYIEFLKEDLKAAEEHLEELGQER